MKQKLLVSVNGKLLRFQVEKIYESGHLERYKVYGANKDLVFQTNRKYFKAKGLKYRKGEWSLVEGVLNNVAALESIIKALEALK